MGCGASTNSDAIATREQANQMCQDACVRMQVVCIKAAFDSGEKIVIDPPKEIGQLKTAVAALVTKAGEVGDAAPATSGGGLMGSVMNAAKGAAATAGSAGLTAAAAGLNALTEKLDEPFQTVAQDIMAKKKDALYNICVEYINKFPFNDPVKIARNEIDGTGYDTVPAGAISLDLAGLTENALRDKMLPDVTEAIKDHLITTGWDKAQKAYTAAYDLATKVLNTEDMAKVGITPIRCDLNEYIAGEIWKVLAARMAKEEDVVRKLDPASKGAKDITKPVKPIAFALVFSPDPIKASQYQAWTVEGK